MQLHNKEFEERYKELLIKADIIFPTPVKGCNVLKDYGYQIWEMIRRELDSRLKNMGFKNMYFPQFIPHSQLKKQDEHYRSFIRETIICPKAGEHEFADQLIIRPTSEAIIYPSIKEWIKTEKDLPLLLNQWCSIVRWEILKDNFPLIRDNEFLWHEAHSCHNSEEECDEYTLKLFNMQRDYIQNSLAIPVFDGKKPERRKFAGAQYTLALEAMMRNCKGVQIATSHSLGQRFSIPFQLEYMDDFGNKNNVWQSCSGMTTRLIGALALVHADKQGLVLPPKIAPYEIAIIDENNLDDKNLFEKIKDNHRIVTGKDSKHWLIKGVPLIICKDTITRRDTLESMSLENITEQDIKRLLKEIQKNLLLKAMSFKDEHTLKANDYHRFKEHLEQRKGFCISSWCGDTECSRIIRKETLGSLRLINSLKENHKCIRCGNEGRYEAVFGQSY